MLCAQAFIVYMCVVCTVQCTPAAFHGQPSVSRRQMVRSVIINIRTSMCAVRWYDCVLYFGIQRWKLPHNHSMFLFFYFCFHLFSIRKHSHLDAPVIFSPFSFYFWLATLIPFVPNPCTNSSRRRKRIQYTICIYSTRTYTNCFWNIFKLCALLIRKFIYICLVGNAFLRANGNNANKSEAFYRMQSNVENNNGKCFVLKLCKYYVGGFGAEGAQS